MDASCNQTVFCSEDDIIRELELFWLFCPIINFFFLWSDMFGFENERHLLSMTDILKLSGKNSEESDKCKKK